MADEMDFTPSEDQMREDYKLFAGDGEDRAKAHAEFNRGMERIKAQVRAEELREAYADLQAYTDSGAPFGHRPVEEFLLHRADRIEREAGLK